MVGILKQKNAHNRFGPPHAVFNLSKIGLRYFRIGIKASISSKEKLLLYFINHPNVGWIFYAKGWFNLAIGLWAKDNAEINDVSAQIRKVLTPKDKIIFQSELTSLYSFGNRPITGKGQPMRVVDAVIRPINFSPIEFDCIKLLAFDSSISSKELSEILGVNIRTLREIKKKLVDSGIIVGHQERIEYKGLYFKVFVDSLSRKVPDAIDKLIQSLWEDKACIYLGRANSKYDFEFELILDKKSDVKKYLKNFSDYKIAVFLRNLYTNLYPLNKIANLKEIKDTLSSQQGKIIDFRNSKLWYLNYKGVDAYLSIYENRKYFEIMEKSELDLFKSVINYIKKDYINDIFNVIDIGSGNGLKGRIFIKKIGEKLVKAYYPIDIQSIELAATLRTHIKGTYAKHPTFLDIENLSVRFPLSVAPKEKQIYVFLGGTYGNFPQEKINSYLKPLIGLSNILLITMPIISEGKTDQEIIDLYTNIKNEDFAFGPLLQMGLKKGDFEIKPKYRNLRLHHNIEDHKLIGFFILKNNASVFNERFAKGTIFKMTTSWKPSLNEFKNALEKDFVIEKIFHNKKMAIAVIKSKRFVKRAKRIVGCVQFFEFSFRGYRLDF